MMKAAAAALFLSLIPFAAFAQEDAEGCVDSTTLSRMPKCHISSCEKKDYDEADIRIGVDGDSDFKKQHLEGAKDYLEYECDASVSYLNIARNAEAALKKGGFTIVWSGAGQNGRPALAARKGGVWIGIQTETNQTNPVYFQTVVVTKAMEETMTANAAAFEEEINRTGSCSIYGILFDSGKALVKPESAECLGEVIKLLQKNAEWRMQIEGHTDNVGTSSANAALSQQRADAVKSWLVAHGIAATRLTTRGFGDTKPVALNATDDGRAKNRRVALTKL